MPDIVYADEDTKYVGFDIQTIRIPPFSQLEHLIAGYSFIKKFWIYRSLFFEKSARRLHSVTGTEMPGSIGLIVLFIPTGVGYGIALEQNDSVLLQSYLRVACSGQATAYYLGNADRRQRSKRGFFQKIAPIGFGAVFHGFKSKIYYQK
jgi:hypothetical protein